MLNYTTKIDAAKTVGEIQQILSKKGVRKIVIDYDDDGQPIGVTFVAIWTDNQGINIPTLFALPCRWQGVQNALVKMDKTSPKQCTEEHARRVAWRVIKDWVEAQMAIIESEAVSLAEVFLPYAVTRDGGTLYELASGRERNQLQLQSPTS